MHTVTHVSLSVIFIQKIDISSEEDDNTMETTSRSRKISYPLDAMIMWSSRYTLVALVQVLLGVPCKTPPNSSICTFYYHHDQQKKRSNLQSECQNFILLLEKILTRCEKDSTNMSKIGF